MRSASLAAHAYISSIVLGGLRTSKRPSAFAGPWLQPIRLGHPRDGIDAVLVGKVGHELHRVAVEDHRLLAVVAEIDRHHLGVDGGQRVEPKLLGDLRRHGELHRARDLVAEPIDELDGGRHPAGVGVGLEAHRAQTRLLQDRRGGEPVVTGADDDRVIVAHGS